MIFLSFFLSFTLWANPFIRLDKFSTEEFKVPERGILMFMSEGCVHCKAQVRDFQSCVAKSVPITLFMEGKNEDRLRKDLRRKPLPYPVYWTTAEIKAQFEVGQATPVSVLVSPKGKQKIEGRLECEKLQPFLDKLF